MQTKLPTPMNIEGYVISAVMSAAHPVSAVRACEELRSLTICSSSCGIDRDIPGKKTSKSGHECETQTGEDRDQHDEENLAKLR